MHALDLRPISNRPTDVRFDWYRYSLKTSVRDGPSSYLTIGLSIADWIIEEPTVLPDDKIVFEWGGQIVLFDPHTRSIAFVAMGTCPAFVPKVESIPKY